MTLNEKHLPLANLIQDIGPSSLAVLVIDMQNDYCSPDGALSKAGFDLSRVDPMISQMGIFLETARQTGLKVIFIKTVRTSNDVSEPQKYLLKRQGRSGHSCEKGTWGADIIENLCPRKGEIVFEKKKYSAFVGTELDSTLKQLGIRILVFIGVATNVCVETTARDGFMRDYHIVMLSDLTSSPNEELHAGTLANIDKWFGIVTTSEQFLEAWRAVQA
jgi:ureidoacrylate peracid hydrolase